MKTQTGTVKWFSDDRGFGFITPDDDSSKALFTHFQDIQQGGFHTLVKHQRVRFEVTQSSQGAHALNIRAAS